MATLVQAGPQPMDTATLVAVTQYLATARRQENVRFSEIYEYLQNRIVDIYIPKGASAEFKMLVDQSRWNVLPQLEAAVANKCVIEGYRTGDTNKNSPIWDKAWQPNRMDARQSGIWTMALRYGMSYGVVLPGTRQPNGSAEKVPASVITPWSPRRLTAIYRDPLNDQWPIYFITVGIPYPTFDDGKTIMVTPVKVYDDNFEYSFTLPATVLQMPTYAQGVNMAQPFNETVTIDANAVKTSRHGLGVAPAVRFMQSYSDLDGGPEGILWPMLPNQRSINQTTFSAKMVEQFAAWRQKYAIGLEIQYDADGRAIQPFDARIDSILQIESELAKFGEFSATDLTPYLNSRDKQLAFVATSRSLPPQTLVVGDQISNVNAEALAMLQAEHTQDIAILRTSFGEGGEQLMRLCGKAIGDTEAWEDESAQVRWRDTTPRSLAQIADALGKMATMLGVPPRALWERIPGVTQQDLEMWEKKAEEDRKNADSFAKLEGLMNGANPGGSRANPATSGAPVGADG